MEQQLEARRLTAILSADVVGYSRLMAGGICISRTVFNHVRNKVTLAFEDLGESQVKNIPDPVQVYRVDLSQTDTDRVSRGSDPARPPLPDKPSTARISAPPA